MKGILRVDLPPPPRLPLYLHLVCDVHQDLAQSDNTPYLLFSLEHIRKKLLAVVITSGTNVLLYHMAKLPLYFTYQVINLDGKL